MSDGIRMSRATPTSTSTRRGVSLIAALLVAAAAAAPGARAISAETTRVSVSSLGAEANGISSRTAISASGRFIVFASYAKNLVEGDTTDYADIYLHDRKTGSTTRISLGVGGTEPNSNSDWPSISAGGRYIAFESSASNLVPNDDNTSTDVFVHDRETGKTRRVSVNSAEAQGNERSDHPSISADGRFVAFASRASNLVGGDTNNAYDVFVRDREFGTTKRVSVSSSEGQGNAGSEAPSISADGQFVAFSADASNLVGGDTNGEEDVFVRDRETGKTRRISVNSAEVQGNGWSFQPTISADGRSVAFRSDASNLVAGDTNGTDVFVRDLGTGTTRRVSVNSDSLQSNGSSTDPSISRDGRFVVFRSDASNLAYGDTNGFYDIFLHDRQTGTTRRISLNTAGTVQANGDSIDPVISADGRFVAFATYASSLVEGDTNGWLDVLLRGPMR